MEPSVFIAMANSVAARQRIVQVRSPGPDACLLAFAGCDPVIENLRTILRGWEVRDDTPARAPALVRLSRTRRGYLRVSPWSRTPSKCRETLRKHGSDALYGVQYDLLRWFVDAQRKQPCLHGAAVRFGNGLVVFPSTSKAGKSTLAIQLAMDGHLVFCDDWLPIRQPGNLGLALGILPWIRLPLPAEVRNEFGRFLRARRGPRNRRWMYVDLKADELAAHGTTAPVRGLVLLERIESGPASLNPVAKDRMLGELVQQNYAGRVPVLQSFDALHGLASGAQCLALRYASVPDAARLLRMHFGGPDDRS